jgi:hypothetical protein
MKTPHFRVAIIIPALNNPALTSDCLTSIKATTQGHSIAVVVADNGSEADSLHMVNKHLAATFPENGFLLQHPAGTPFGVACTRAGQAVDSDFLFLLNNDTLCEDGWLPPLLAAFDDTPDLGAAGPLLLFPETRTVQHLGVAFHPDMGPEHIYSHVPGTHPLCQVRRPVQAITGAAMLIPRPLFYDMGAFHEGYRNGFEDLELCCRLRQAGRSVRVVPTSTVLHVGGSTEGRFASDIHNGRLLRERCPDCFEPDFHALVTRDGFEVRLTRALDPYPALPRERGEELARRAADKPLSVIMDTLARELFWEEGYHLAISRLEAAGDLSGALGVRYTQSLFMPHAANAAALAGLAARCGHTDLARAVSATCDTLLSRERDTAALAQTARRYADLFAARGDERHAALYRRWLEPAAPPAH